VVTATFIAQRIATPIVTLSNTATKIANGDLAQRAEVEGKKEIKTLAHAFNRMTRRLREMLQDEEIRRAELEREIAEREKAEAEREQLLAEQAALQQEVIEAQREALRDLSTPVIPVMEHILVMPLVGSIDTLRARDIMRALLESISEHRAKVVILDVTGVPVMDTGVVNHLTKTLQAARLKGAHTIVTGISDAVAEAMVDLGIDWSGVETWRDLQTGLRVARDSMDIQL
jgi:rsbT co-antagonist protein RsbR